MAKILKYTVDTVYRVNQGIGKICDGKIQCSLGVDGRCAVVYRVGLDIG